MDELGKAPESSIQLQKPKEEKENTGHRGTSTYVSLASFGKLIYSADAYCWHEMSKESKEEEQDEIVIEVVVVVVKRRRAGGERGGGGE